MWASSNNKYKTAMCKHFQQNGACNLGAKCHFAHGPEELRTLNDPLPAHTPLTQQPSKQMKPTPNLSATSLPPTIANYKTVKCRFFEKGFCKFAQNCGFAHGDTEIRSQNSPLPQNIANITQSIGGGSHTQAGNAQNQVVQEQISYLIAQMQAYHTNDPELLAKIKQAQEINQLGNYQGAASLVYGIIERPDKSKEDNENYHVFIQNIQNVQTVSSPVYQQQQQQQQHQQYQPQYYQQQDAYGMSHHQPQHTGKPSHNNRQQHQQQHHQQSQSHPNYNPYEAHSQSGAYPESPYHSQSYKSPNQNYQNTYQQQGSPYQQSIDMQGLTSMMGNFQPYGNQNYNAYQGGATQQGQQHRG